MNIPPRPTRPPPPCPLELSPEHVADDLLKILRPPKRADSTTRIRAGQHKQQLLGLRHAGRTAEFLAPGVMQMRDLIVLHAGSTTFDGLFKEQSHRGFDVHRNRCIDYGNVVYKTVLVMCQFQTRKIEEALRESAIHIPSLHYAWGDSNTSLLHAGDLVEALLGVCRGDDFLNIRATTNTDNARWQQAYNELCQLCHSIDYLRALIQGRHVKRSTLFISSVLPDAHVPDTSLFLAMVALSLAPRL